MLIIQCKYTRLCVCYNNSQSSCRLNQRSPQALSELFKPKSTILGDSSVNSLHQLLVISQLYLSLCLLFSLSLSLSLPLFLSVCICDNL